MNEQKFELLRLIHHKKPTMGELAKELGIGESDMKKILQNLENEGFLILGTPTKEMLQDQEDNIFSLALSSKARRLMRV